MREKQAIELGVDSREGPVVDPTENVIALTKAESKRQDDLRDAAKELSDAKIAHQKEIGDIRERHQEQLRKAESERLDSIRQVDREDVNKTAAQALSAIATLAAATSTTAETLRSQVATTAQAAATSLTNSMGEVNKRLSALELSSSASGAGTAGEKSGRVSQQQLIQWLIYLILAAIAIAAYVRKG